jgi:short-subunit dehydrogenase
MVNREKFRSKYGPWALVTGAARGMGAEFSRQLADIGLNLVMVDMLADELAATASEIQTTRGIDVRTVTVDLSRTDFQDRIRPHTDDVEVGLMVSSAAHTPIGLFFEQSLEDKFSMVDVNLRAPLILVEEFGARMVARRRGGIILISSASALQGVAYVASYAATKAYNLILAESLWDELRGSGVDVLGFMPAATRTTGFILSEPRLERARFASVMEVKPTVREALASIGRSPSRIAGTRNRLTILLAGKLLPRKTLIRVIGNNMRGWYGKD